ncbi:hypothetical protein BJ170DRAFT_139753 [Xylariales sp. AK1849]|nr:hypothetical protein BJ170DRAFT_139753 [Xylariales sp. AK1849]
MSANSGQALSNPAAANMARGEKRQRTQDEQAQLDKIYDQMDDLDYSLTRHQVQQSTLCANCNKIGHRLADCVWPYSIRHGDIFGCPICNTKDHGFDECTELFYLTYETKVNYLCKRRAGKPLIRSDFDIYEAVRRLETQSAPNL